MGIKGFFDVQINKETTIRNLRKPFDISEKKICVDSSCIVYKYFHATLKKNLTDKENIDTYTKYVTNLIKGLIDKKVLMIWVFDSGKNVFKEHTTQIRKKSIENILLKEIKSIVPDVKNLSDVEIINNDSEVSFTYDNEIYTCLNITPSRKHFNILKNILEEYNIQYVIADKIEAEQLAVKICKEYSFDGVLSPDSDVLIFGYNVIQYDKGDYFIYYLDEILKEMDITLSDLCIIGIILGCDFCEKTEKIGPKRVLKKFKDIKLPKAENILTIQQQIIHDYLLRPIEFNIPMLPVLPTSTAISSEISTETITETITEGISSETITETITEGISSETITETITEGISSETITDTITEDVSKANQAFHTYDIEVENDIDVSL